MAHSRVEAGDQGPSRRQFLGASAAFLAGGVAGCLGGARTEIPRGPALWPVFRFAHLGAPVLGFRADGARVAWTLHAARAAGALSELDFVILGGQVVEGRDPFDFLLLDEAARTAGRPWCGLSSAEGAAAWARSPCRRPRPIALPTPWEASPVRGLRLVAIDTSSPAAAEAQLPFLTSVIEAHPDEALFVLTDTPPRAPDGVGTVDSEWLRFVLEASPSVKAVLSGLVSESFVKETAGLLGIGTPSPWRAPHLVREITVVGHGLAVRDRFLEPGRGRGAERQYALR